MEIVYSKSPEELKRKEEEKDYENQKRNLKVVGGKFYERNKSQIVKLVLETTKSF